jgi:hypothetical protein
MTNNLSPYVAPPADATRIHNWSYIFNTDELHRFFYGTQRGEPVPVGICGYQNPDGSVRARSIFIDNAAAREFDPAAARQLARALIAAADEVDELANHDRCPVAQSTPTTGS